MHILTVNWEMFSCKRWMSNPSCCMLFYFPFVFFCSLSVWGSESRGSAGVLRPRDLDRCFSSWSCNDAVSAVWYKLTWSQQVRTGAALTQWPFTLNSINDMFTTRLYPDLTTYSVLLISLLCLRVSLRFVWNNLINFSCSPSVSTPACGLSVAVVCPPLLQEVLWAPPSVRRTALMGPPPLLHHARSCKARDPRVQRSFRNKLIITGWEGLAGREAPPIPFKHAQ